MSTLFSVLLIFGLISLIVFVMTKYFGLFKDEDKNGVPDKIEEKIDAVKDTIAEVKVKAKKVKDVAKATKKVIKQSKDNVKVAITKTGGGKGRKPKQ
jgi:hypothetical protein